MLLECIVNNHPTPERDRHQGPPTPSRIEPELAGSAHWAYALPWIIMPAILIGTLVFLCLSFEKHMAAKQLSETGAAYGVRAQR